MWKYGFPSTNLYGLHVMSKFDLAFASNGIDGTDDRCFYNYTLYHDDDDDDGIVLYKM